MHDAEGKVPLPRQGPELQHAARVAGGDHLGARGCEAFDLAGAYSAGEVGLQQVVDARRTATVLGPLVGDEPQARHAGEQPPGLTAHALAMAEVARIVVGDLAGVRGRTGTEPLLIE